MGFLRGARVLCRLRLLLIDKKGAFRKASSESRRLEPATKTYCYSYLNLTRKPAAVLRSLRKKNPAWAMVSRLKTGR